ncbi:hypothetical protein J3R30DRAFT_3452486 [Lentinula aciculospora]|uniref:Uncharacterized protein n=1 Tax=Lentinula aciculospora TaxID=153920 RepID=A0A9W9DSR2_9AGAR|nr:hypothetical protein J3R30DRAFT_3452486 [Lentinula aciculospora]
MHPRRSFLLLQVLCVLTVTHLAAAYRPYRPHDTSVNLAKPHRVPNGYKTDYKREITPAEAPSSANVNIRALPGSPISSSHPSQIPPCGPDCPPVAVISSGSESARSVVGELNDGKLPPIPRITNTTIAPSKPSLLARQIHNADYGSSNAPPSSSSDSNSTEQVPSSSPSAYQPSATDSAHRNEKRKDVKEDVQAGRRLPRAAAMRRMDTPALMSEFNKTGSTTASSATPTETNSPQRRLPRASAMRRANISELVHGSNKDDTSTSSANSTETKPNSSPRESAPGAMVRRADVLGSIPGFNSNENGATSSSNSTQANSGDSKRLSRAVIPASLPKFHKNGTTTSSSNSTQMKSEGHPPKRLPRAAAMRRTIISELTPGSNENSIPSNANSTNEYPSQKHNSTSAGTKGPDGNTTTHDNGVAISQPNAAKSQPERRLIFRFRR